MEEINETMGNPTPQNKEQECEWKSDSIKNLLSSLSQFQGSLGSVSKDKTNPFFNSSYADINAILGEVRQTALAIVGFYFGASQVK